MASNRPTLASLGLVILTLALAMASSGCAKAPDPVAENTPAPETELTELERESIRAWTEAESAKEVSALGSSSTFTESSLDWSGAPDGFTFPIPHPDRRIDGQDHLSGPQHWVATVSPVEPQVPGTRPVTRMHGRRLASDGKVEEHWESCDDACGPGCGGKPGKLMGGCDVVNGPQNPLQHSWTKADGKRVTCGYETWSCKSHDRCQRHDRCLLKCKLEKGNSAVCKFGCHLQASGLCATVGGWIWGDPIFGCSDKKLDYSRVIPGSCREG